MPSADLIDLIVIGAGIACIWYIIVTTLKR